MHGQDWDEGLKRPTIERLTARPRPDRVTVEIDRIFFASSATQSFADEATRAAFRERWLGRYLAQDPGLAHLAILDAGRPEEAIAGYIVGALEDPARSARFSDLGYFQKFKDVTARFPAQLHVNLDARWRGQGIGRDLVEAFVEDARAAGAPGVHAVTSRGMRNIRFYDACGFKEAGCCDWNGRELVMLGRALQ